MVVVTTGDAAAPAGQPSTPVEGSAVVPPSAAGGTSTTAVTVTTSSGSVTLDQPYATADVTAAGVISTRKMEETEVNTRFGEALSAKPPRPISYVLYFLEGSDRLTPDSEASLDQVKADLAKWPAPQVSVIGHTDTVGNPAINDKLALQRAELVKRTLVGIGIAPEGIEVVSRGERELLVQTGDEVPEPRNRRVEINIR